MNKKSHLLVLSSLLITLSSCGGTPASSSSVSSASTSSESSSEVATSESSASSSRSESSSSEEIIEEKPVKENVPYINNLDRLKKHEFQGKWIWESRDIADTHVAFRKKITLEKAPSKAKLFLSAESKATVFLNGEVVAIDAVLKRGPSPYDSFYQEIDVTGHLKSGENVLAILVHYWGREGNASVSSGKGGMIFDLVVDSKTISSDTSVKVKRMTSYANQRTLSPSGEYPDRERSTFLAEREIYYDARKEIDFASPGLDDSSWDDAAFVASPGYLPFGDLYLGDIPAFSYGRLEEAEDIDNVIGAKLTEAKTAHFKLRENMQFLPYFEFESEEEGKKISFYTNTYRTTGIVSLMDDYVSKQGHNAYQQLYWRSGEELILELPAGVTLTKVGYRETRYQTGKIHGFESSSKEMDSLFEKANNTLVNCMRDTFMDCPERERSPYAGDSSNQIDECLYSMEEDAWKMIKKTYQTLSGWASSDSTFRLRWPSKTSNECPMQNLAFLIAVPNYLDHTGDKETVKDIYPILSSYLKIWELNDDGSVKYRNGTFMWTDWGSKQDEELMENAWYYWGLNAMKSLGEELGENDDSAYYSDRMTRIKGAFSAKFKKTDGYSSDGKNYDDRGNALAILSGIIDEEDYPHAIQVIDAHENASPYMERYVLEALAKAGEMEKCQARMLKRYADMISDPCSTLWELWGKEEGTPNHGWTGGPLVVMSRYYAGIQPTSSGYATYDLKPSSFLDSFATSTYTPNGEIAISYSKQNKQMAIKATSNGTLYLEEGFGEVAEVSGATLKGERTYSLSEGEVLVKFA